MNAREYLYRPEWLNIVDRSGIDHDNKEESKLSLSLSLAGLFFFPISFVRLWIGRSSMTEEGRNRFNTASQILSIPSITIYTALFIALFFVRAPIF